MELFIELKNGADTKKIMRYLGKAEEVQKVYLMSGNKKKVIDVRNKEFVNTLSIIGADTISNILPKEESPIF